MTQTTPPWGLAKAPAVVAFGGGHGLSASLRALRLMSDRLTAVVTVADDGGSSGRLRDEMGVLPPGDLRMALAALTDETDWGRLWRDVLLFAGIDLLLVSQTLFFLQGLAVVQWFVQTRQVQAGGKSALYVVAVLGQVFLQLTGLLGLFDTWLDCRKRFAPKSPHADVPGGQR